MLTDPSTLFDDSRWLGASSAHVSSAVVTPSALVRSPSAKHWLARSGADPLTSCLNFDLINGLDDDPTPGALVLSPAVTLAQEVVRGFKSKEVPTEQLHRGALTKADEGKRVKIVKQSGERPKLYVDGVERRVLWYRRAERSQGELSKIAERKGAKDAEVHAQKQIEKVGWHEWRPPLVEDAEIMKVEEAVGGVVRIERVMKSAARKVHGIRHPPDGPIPMSAWRPHGARPQ